MLPNSSSSTSRTVFINPNFKTTTHINPNFIIKKPSTTIHVNPNFIDKIKETQDNQNAVKPQIQSLPMETKPLAKIIEKSKTKLVRVAQNNTIVPGITKKTISTCSVRSPLIKIGLRKLIRASTSVPSKLSITNKLASNLSTTAKYKIDRRIRTKSLNGVKKKKPFVSQFALNRGNESLSSKKLLITTKKILNNASKPQSKLSFAKNSVNKKLELLSINGVLYKSTRNKLQRSDSTVPNKQFPSKISTGERVLFVRGNKFVLDKSGLKLTKVPVENKFPDRTKLARIDLGGLTYIAKSNNIYIRTDIHKTRNHLSVAKQKSINVLSNRLVKSNLPCQIFRKLGKCAGFDRRKCPKLHEKIHVDICAKFLKGECINKNCLLSHNVSLSKMPVCKFFLQGCCVREDCPYLHKKLSQKAEICLDFLKGFCSLADKCDKRHEFLCPDFESKGKCEKVKCIYCRKKSKFNKIPTKIDKNTKVGNNLDLKNQISEKDKVLVEKASGLSRYFIDEINTLNSNKNIIIGETIKYISDESEEDSEEIVENLFPRRPKLGDLPAFIPL